MTPRGDAAATISAALVKNINPSGDSYPYELTAIGTSFYFRADDGSAAGTVLVKDIYPGSGYSSPSNFASVGSTLYFSATDGINGIELWKSDGTGPGTSMVKDIYAGSNGSNPEVFTAFNGSLYFRANDGTNGVELWKSDGTAAGTVMVKDIYPKGNSWPAQAVVFGGAVYFVASEPVHGQELWRSDGTEAGTQRVSDVHPGASGGVMQVASSSNAVYFRGDDGSHGSEVWKVTSRIDNSAPPQTTIVKHPSKLVRTKTTKAKVSFVFKSSKKGSHFSCKLDKGKWSSCRSPKSYKVKLGKHTFQVRATSSAGKTDRSPAKWVWKVKRRK